MPQIFIFVLAQSFFIENLQSFFFRFFVNLAQIFVSVDVFFYEILVKILRLFQSFVRLDFTHRQPSIFDVRNISAVQSIYHVFYEVQIHVAVQGLPVQRFHFHAVEDFFSQRQNLLQKFRTQFLNRKVLQILQLTFVRQWTNHRETISVFKVSFNQPSNFIFRVVFVTISFQNFF